MEPMSTDELFSYLRKEKAIEKAPTSMIDPEFLRMGEEMNALHKKWAEEAGIDYPVPK